MKTFYRYSFILLVLVVFLIAAVVYLVIFTNNNSKKLYENLQTEETTFLNSTLTLKGDSIRTLVDDYTFWDEMVDYIKKPDTTWANQNLDVTFNTFNNDVLWVFDKNFNIIYSKNSNELSEKFPIENVSEIFANSRVVHFFAESDNGPMEIWGSSVHPTADNERKTDPQGYLFAAKHLNSSYIKNIEDITNLTLTIKSSKENSPIQSVDAKNGIIKYYIQEKDYKGETLFFYDAEKAFPVVSNYYNETNRNQLIFLIAASLIAITLAAIVTYISRITSRAIFEEEKANVNLKSSQELFRAISDHSPFGILLVNEKNKIVYINDTFKKIAALSEENVNSNDWKVNIKEDFKNTVDVFLTDQDKEEIVFPFEQKDNIEIWVNLKYSLIKVGNSVSGTVYVIYDITKEKSSEFKLQEKNSELEKMNQMMVDREIKMVELKKKLDHEE